MLLTEFTYYWAVILNSSGIYFTKRCDFFQYAVLIMSV